MDAKQTQDTEELKDAVNKRKLSCFDHMAYTMRLSETDLKATGHKSIADALLYSMKSGIKDCETLTKEYLKKYPD